MPKQNSPASKPFRPLRAAVVTLLVLGVLLGLSRWVGDGRNITDPGWMDAARANVQKVFNMGGKAGKDINDQVDKGGHQSPSNRPSSGAPSPTSSTHATP